MATLFEDLIQNIPAVFYRCKSDENWTMLYLNEAVEDLIGYPPCDLVENTTRTFASVIHPDDIQQAFTAVNNAIAKQESWSLEYRVISRDGKTKWVSENGVATFADNGDVLFLDGFITDISERVKLRTDVEQARETLSERERFFQALMHGAVDAIIVISQQGIIEEFNEAAEKLFGYSAEEVVGQNVSIFAPDEHARKHDSYLKRYLDTKEARIVGIGREVEGKRRDGTLFPMLLSVSEVITGEGDSRFAGIVRDLTEQKSLEAELSRAHKMEAVGQLAAGIAHEINTPIQFVSDNLHFLADAFKELEEIASIAEQLVNQDQQLGDQVLVAKLKDKIADSDLQYLLEDIPASIGESQDGVNRVSEIVGAMKEFSHPGNKNKESVDLKKMIESTLIVARNEWKYVADVETDYESDLPMVECFPGEISQAILNIVVNAAHAIESRRDEENCQDKGVIKVKTFKEDDYSVIRISDTGCGINKEHLDKVFDPFFTTKEVGRGTGQGLSMVYATITDNHNGKIELNSVPGEGTTMSIKLP